MKYLFMLLVLMSCNKKEEVVNTWEPLKVEQCYENDSYYFKVLKIYKYDTYKVRAINREEDSEKVWSQPDMKQIKNLDCAAFNDIHEKYQTYWAEKKTEFQNQCIECLKHKVECNAEKESPESN